MLQPTGNDCVTQRIGSAFGLQLAISAHLSLNCHPGQMQRLRGSRPQAWSA